MPNGSERKIVAITLIGTLVCVVIFKDGATGSFMNLMFVVVGYYFGNGKTPGNSEG